MKFWHYFEKIDRRVVFLLVGLAVLIPLIFPFSIPTNVMPPTEKLFNTVDDIVPENQGILISVDYAPQTSPELQPMYTALLRHAFVRRIPVVVMSGMIQGLGLARKGLDDVVFEFNQTAQTYEDSIVYGRDYVFLGWPPLWLAAVLRMGSDINRAFPADYYKNSTGALDMMSRVKSYSDIGIIVSIAGNTMPQSWVTYVNTRFGVSIGAGVTAVMAADFYPFLNTGQLTGMMAGLKGASEYEYMVNNRHNLEGETTAIKYMSSQSVAHVAILVLIIIGNIGFFVSRRRKT